jgi:hypothetical protein
MNNNKEAVGSDLSDILNFTSMSCLESRLGWTVIMRVRQFKVD